jgi:hypothetical protein
VTAALNRIEKTVALSVHKMLDSTSLMSEAAGLSTGFFIKIKPEKQWLYSN